METPVDEQTRSADFTRQVKFFPELACRTSEDGLCAGLAPAERFGNLQDALQICSCIPMLAIKLNLLKSSANHVSRFNSFFAMGLVFGSSRFKVKTYG